MTAALRNDAGKIPAQRNTRYVKLKMHQDADTVTQDFVMKN
ncbi:hypothetical protein [Paenibacillus spongiae]|nr:hypothetical protein [Paenibacillus spongiae]